VTEVVVAGRIFVVVAERDRGDDLADAVRLHEARLVYAVIIGDTEILAFLDPPFDTDGSP
jgi:hypothetical protein